LPIAKKKGCERLTYKLEGVERGDKMEKDVRAQKRLRQQIRPPPLAPNKKELEKKITHSGKGGKTEGRLGWTTVRRDGIRSVSPGLV